MVPLSPHGDRRPADPVWSKPRRCVLPRRRGIPEGYMKLNIARVQEDEAAAKLGIEEARRDAEDAMCEAARELIGAAVLFGQDKREDAMGVLDTVAHYIDRAKARIENIDAEEADLAVAERALAEFEDADRRAVAAGMGVGRP